MDAGNQPGEQSGNLSQNPGGMDQNGHRMKRCVWEEKKAAALLLMQLD